jgi:di/tricarboxylate transporter
MFELSAVGIIMFTAGMIYMMLIGRRMLPNRGGEDSFTEQYRIREFISELLVLPDSSLVGKTLGEAKLNADLDLHILGIVRSGETIASPNPDERIKRRDSLLVEGTIDDILRVKEQIGLEIKADFMLHDSLLESGEVELFEVMVLRDSRLVGQTLKSIRFRQTYDLTTLAINRHGETFINKLSSVTLKFGDVLLVQGTRENIEPLVIESELLLLEDVSANSMRVDKRKWAIALSKVVVGFDIPLTICVLAGVLLLLATKTIRQSEMYSLIDFRLLVLIACMMSFGVAMEKTGADAFLAGYIQTYFGHYGDTAVLAGFFLLTVLLTQPMSNQAAALVILPVAVKAAVALGLNPRTFIVGITYAASFSFITPLEPACVLVYGFCEGRYDPNGDRLRRVDSACSDFLAIPALARPLPSECEPGLHPVFKFVISGDASARSLVKARMRSGSDGRRLLRTVGSMYRLSFVASTMSHSMDGTPSCRTCRRRRNHPVRGCRSLSQTVPSSSSSLPT